MKITVETNSGVFDFECEATDKLLYAGLTHGLTLPYECATGTCGTCRRPIIQGSVDVEGEHAPGSAKLKRVNGNVLIRHARPAPECFGLAPVKCGFWRDPRHVPS